MKRKILTVLLAGMLCAVSVPAYVSAEETAQEENAAAENEEDWSEQNSIDEALKAELQNGYTAEEPLVVVNPYGTSPLTAVAIFTTEEELGGTVTVKGKDEANDITGTFEAATEHIVPIYGLYSGDTTEVVLTLEDGTETKLEVTTDKTETEIGEIKTTTYDEEAYDNTCLTLVCSTNAGLYALDQAGDIRWYYSGMGLGVHQLENGHLMLPSSNLLKKNYYSEGLIEMDLCGRIYHKYLIPGGMHHDFQELPDGNFLVASDSPDFSSVEDYVVEIDRDTGDVVWELDMKDLLDTQDGASASMDTDGSDESDWFHNNAVWYDEENDLVLLSARHKDAIIAVNKSDKTLAWILGDPEGWENVDKSLFFTPVGDDFEWQYAQHQVSMLDNGDIMMFDNGTAKVKGSSGKERVSGDDIYSRAVIYHIDTDAMTIEQVYSYGKERGAEWYSDWISGVVSLDGTKDHLWITAGSHLYNAEEDRHDYYPADMFEEGLTKSTHIDQVDNGELSYEIVITGDTAAALTYRSFRINLYGEGTASDLSQEPETLGSIGDYVPEFSETTEETATEETTVSEETENSGETTSEGADFEDTSLTETETSAETASEDAETVKEAAPEAEDSAESTAAEETAGAGDASSEKAEDTVEVDEEVTAE